jgi:hypothetical protein
MIKPLAPQLIWDETGEEYLLAGFSKPSPLTILLDYQQASGQMQAKMTLQPHQVETQFHREKPTPQQNPILQGKYECAPAALAMAMGEKLFTVKRQMGKLLWRNDDAGVGDELLRATARSLGRDLVEIPLSEVSPNLGPCILTVKSLNVKGYSHAVAWTGKELLDPNTHYLGRHYWGADWGPDMIGAKACHLLLNKPLSNAEHNEYVKVLKERNDQQIKEIKQQVLLALQQVALEV